MFLKNHDKNSSNNYSKSEIDFSSKTILDYSVLLFPFHLSANRFFSLIELVKEKLLCLSFVKHKLLKETQYLFSIFSSFFSAECSCCLKLGYYFIINSWICELYSKFSENICWNYKLDIDGKAIIASL